MQKLIQSCQIQSDVNPEIHTFQKKLKAFEEFGIGELALYNNHKSLPINSFKCLNKFASLVNFLIARSPNAPFAAAHGPAMAEMTKATVLVMNPVLSTRMPFSDSKLLLLLLLLPLFPKFKSKSKKSLFPFPLFPKSKSKSKKFPSKSKLLWLTRTRSPPPSRSLPPSTLTNATGPFSLHSPNPARPRRSTMLPATCSAIAPTWTV